jgi:hypothetical protein
VGNSEAGKDLKLIFPNEIKTDVADGETIITSITENNTIYTFKCVTAQEVHTWLLEGTCLYSEIVAIKNRLEAIESSLAEIIGDVE